MEKSFTYYLAEGTEADWGKSTNNCKNLYALETLEKAQKLLQAIKKPNQKYLIIRGQIIDVQ